jgi:hypothetical protein
MIASLNGGYFLPWQLRYKYYFKKFFYSYKKM